MTITHISHFGLKNIGITSDNVLFSGSKGACKRMASAHGMEVEKYEGRILGSDCGIAATMTADSETFSICWFIGGGMVIKGRDDYTLVMPLGVWEQAV